MEAIGKKLQEARERLGLSLDEVEQATRIRLHHLQALERGDLTALPSPVQARGFLRNYADFLGLDSDGLLLEFAEILRANQRRRGAPRPYIEPPTRPSVQVRGRRWRWLSLDLLVSAGVVLALFSLLVWGINRAVMVLEERSPPAVGESLPSPSPTASRVPELVETTPQPPSGVSLTQPVDNSPTPLPPLPQAGEAGIGLRLIIEKRAWLRVLVDGEEVFRGRAVPGERLDFLAQQVIEVTTGNGAGVRVIFQGQDGGLMGGLGAVVTRLWTAEGIITPTPSQTPTATVAPTFTPTPLGAAPPEGSP
jgi:transcriptional regulator with XRE-family HTH domain